MKTGPLSHAEDVVLAHHARTGGSFGTAAVALDRTRNMVAGRARRLGIRFNSTFELRSSIQRGIAGWRWANGGKATFGRG